eukprot:4808594-Alexandrium_andersonii.AAC.1
MRGSDISKPGFLARWESPNPPGWQSNPVTKTQDLWKHAMRNASVYFRPPQTFHALPSISKCQVCLKREGGRWGVGWVTLHLPSIRRMPSCTA